MKKALALLLAVCLIPFTVGCSGEEDAEDGESGTTESTTSE